MTKKELRKEFLQRRLQLSVTEHQQLSELITRQFFASISLSSVKVLHCYLPLQSKKEPNTWLILNKIQKDYPGISVVLPKVNALTNLVEHYYFEGEHQLKESEWGIPEPDEGTVAFADEIDLVIVPLLAFDCKGNRVGYGKGFYDRFLQDCRHDCQKVGLSFFDPVDTIEDTTAFDIPLTHAVTTRQCYSF